MPVLDFLQTQNGGKAPEVFKVKLGDTLKHLLETVCAHGLHRLFVVDGADHLIGIVTLSDIIAFFWNTTMELWLSRDDL